MAEAAFKQMIATFIRQTRPQTFRHGKPAKYPQRSITTATAARPEAAEDQQHGTWRSHSLAPIENVRVTPEKSRLENLRAESAPPAFSSFLTDNYSREHNYLRISLTERCNLRCLYCMPEEGIQLSPPNHILTTPEIVYLSSIFVNQGVDKIRLTGGEPTVRKDILDLMRQIGQLRSNGLKELCLTTNGISLHRKLDSMVQSGLTGVNLSLDTLDPFQFTIMTRRNGHEAVMKSITRILEMNKVGAGIKLKINCVVMRGLNDKEIVPFVELGKEKDLEVRFIEYMPFDGNKWSKNKMLSFQEMLALIRQQYPDVYKVQDHPNDTSKTYKVPGFVGRIGFITSMTHNFCGTCNRLRITSDGNLKVCLFGNSEVSLRDILRESNDGKPIDSEAMEAIKQIESDRRQAMSGTADVLGTSEQESKLLNIIGAAVKRKKEKHAGIGELENMKNRPMILIDESPQAQISHTSYRIQSPLREPSPLLAIRSNTAFSKSIPVHLLTHNSQQSMFQQHRYRSTFLLRRTYITRKPLKRYVWSQPTYRRVEIDPLQHVQSRETLERVEHIKNDLRRAARRNKAPVRFGTTTSNRFENDDQPAESPALSHLTSSGAAHMINVGYKKETHRSATATAHILFSSPVTYRALKNATLEKGDALAVARIAGIQAAKKTADLIPLAHPGLGITAVKIDLDPFPGTSGWTQAKPDKKRLRDFSVPSTSTSASNSTLNSNLTDSLAEEPIIQSDHGGVHVSATVECYGKTGVEMEALTAANVAILTMYDMLKGIDKAMLIGGCRVTEKRGGKSGSWKWNNNKQRIERFKDVTAITTTPTTTTTTNHADRSSQEEEDFRLSENTNDANQHSSNHDESMTSPWNKYRKVAPNSLWTNTTTPISEETAAIIDDNNPQAIFESEWETLSKSFNQTHTDTNASTTESPTADPQISSNAQSEEEGQPRLRDQLSGSAHGKPDAASFRRARIERYEEWKKTH